MKNYLSVFYLQIKSTFVRIMSVILLMSAVQTTLFIHILNSGDILIPSWFTDETFLSGIEKILQNNYSITIVFSICFILVTVILSLNGCKYASREDYTLRRLNITEKKAMLVKGTYGVFAYSLFFISEALIMFALCCIYSSFAENHPYAFEGSVSNQMIFLAHYRSDLIHSVLPLEDYFKYISTFFAILGMSFSTAFIPYFVKRKRLFLEAFILLPLILLNFTAAWTSGFSSDVFIVGASCFILGVLTVRVSKEEQAYDR